MNACVLTLDGAISEDISVELCFGVEYRVRKKKIIIFGPPVITAPTVNRRGKSEDNQWPRQLFPTSSIINWEELFRIHFGQQFAVGKRI
jgi:hypothetical protein